MMFSFELLFRSKTTMLGMSAITNEKIKKLEEEVHDLKLLKGELINSKNAKMRQRNANEQRV